MASPSTSEWFTPWDDSSLVRLDVPASCIEDVLGEASLLLAPRVGGRPERIRRALEMTARETLPTYRGAGIAHAEVEGIDHPGMTLLRTVRPVGRRDHESGEAVDILFSLVLPPRNARANLRLLAQAASLARSATVLRALREATTPDEVQEVLRDARAPRRARTEDTGEWCVSMMIVRGADALHRLLVGLVDQGLGHAVVTHLDNATDALPQEVPLFASFRDVLGEPGGTHLLVVDHPAERVDDIRRLLGAIAASTDAEDARLLVMPVARHWAMGAQT